MHDPLLGYAIFVCGTSLFKLMLQRCPDLVACRRFRLFDRLRPRRIPINENEFKNLGLAQFVGNMGDVDLVGAAGSFCIGLVPSRSEIRRSLCADWPAFLQHEVLQMRNP